MFASCQVPCIKACDVFPLLLEENMKVTLGPLRPCVIWLLLTAPTTSSAAPSHPEDSNPKFSFSSLNPLFYFQFGGLCICCFSGHKSILPPTLDPSGSFDYSSWSSNDFSKQAFLMAQSTVGPPTALSDCTPPFIRDCG